MRPLMKRLSIQLLFLFCLTAPFARAQETRQGEPDASLVPDQVFRDSLASAEIATYSIDLPAGQFVYGEVDQVSIDAVVTIYDPDDRQVAAFDGPARGLEPFQFTTENAGRYRVEVAPFRNDSGRYTLTLKRIEPRANTPEGRLDQLLAQFRGDDRPGGVVAVIQNGEVTFTRAYGMADLTHGIPNTPETLFNTGSVSKQFAGIAFAMLAEQGILSIDDDVRKYLPELPDFGPTVTLRHLLNHTSGYREVYGVLALEGRRVNGDILKREDAISVVQHQPELQFEPGSQFLYNSTAYVILTTIIERVTGMFYPDWMKQHVFEPLGMEVTRIEREPGDVIPGSAYSYITAARGGYREDFESYAYYGATDLYTNVYDLARWLRNFRTSELGGPGVMKRMLEKSILTNGDTLGYTLGLYVGEYRGLRHLQHSGSTGGYRSFLAYYPDLDAGVAVLANTGAFPVSTVAEEMREIFFGDAMMPEEPAPVVATEESVIIPPRHRQVYPGSYKLEDGPSFNVLYEAGRFFVQPAGERRLPLSPQSDVLFLVDVPERDIRLFFHVEQDGSVISGIVFQNDDPPAPFTRIEPWMPGSDDIEEFTGRYFSEEVEVFYTLSVIDGNLTVHHRRLGNVPLQVKERDTFNGLWPLVEVAFERDESGHVNGFRVSNGRTRSVRFQKI